MNINIGDIVNYATGPIESIPSLVISKFWKWVKIKQICYGEERSFWIKEIHLGEVDTKFNDYIDVIELWLDNKAIDDILLGKE